MTRTYRMSRGVALFFAAFSLVWFGAFVLLAIQLPPAPTLAIVVVLTGLLVIALLPAAATAVLPYRITLSDEGLCVFRSLLRERRIEVHRIHEIGWDEDHVIIRHGAGRVRILTDPVFKPFVARVIEMNPTIAVAGELQESLNEVSA